MRKRITLVAPINTFSGYGQLAIWIVRQVERLTGAYVSIRCTHKSEAFSSTIPRDIKERFVSGPQPEPWEIVLQSVQFRCTPGKRTLYFTMWESTRLPAGCVGLLNLADAIVVPSHWNASVFSACGVDKPIRVVPLGVDPGIFHFRYNSRGFSDLAKPPFVFAAAGRSMHSKERKGLDDAIQAFLLAFPDNPNVRLVIKKFPDDPCEMPDDPRITINNEFLSDSGIADWLDKCDCFVSLAKAEGWGLLQHQAMAVGRPVIACKHSSLCEFYDDRSGYPVRWKMVPVPLNNSIRYRGHWYEPDVLHAAEQMERAYANRNDSEIIGGEASRQAHKFTVDGFGEKLVEVMSEFGVL